MDGVIAAYTDGNNGSILIHTTKKGVVTKKMAAEKLEKTKSMRLRKFKVKKAAKAES